MEAENRTNCVAKIRRFSNFQVARLFWNPIMPNIAKEVVTQVTTFFFDFEKIIILNFEKLRKGIDDGWGLMIN